MDWHPSWTSCKWRGSNDDGGCRTDVTSRPPAARGQAAVICLQTSSKTWWTQNRRSEQGQDEPAQRPCTSGAACGLGAGLWRVTWRMLGGGSTPGPVHPNLTAFTHAHPALYLRPCCRNPDRRQACLDLASELMDPSALLPAALPSAGTWGFCHSSVSPTFPPARCRYFRGFAALWLWLTYHMGNFRKGSGALKGFTMLPLLRFDGVLPRKSLASLLPGLVPAGLERFPSPKTPGDCHPGEGTEAHISPPIRMA